MPLLLVAGLALLACSDDISAPHNYTESFVAGYVNYPNGHPAVGVKIDLMVDYTEVGFPFIIQFWKVDTSTCTGPNGYFSFHFNYADYHEYMVEMRQRYPGTPPQYTLQTLQPGETKYVHLTFSWTAADSIQVCN